MSDERLLSTFLDLVRIDSPTFSEAAVAAYCAERLSAIGFTVTFDDTTAVTGSDSGNLFASLPGTAPGTRVALSAHMDTVEPGIGVIPVVGEDRVVRSSGDTVLGADDKAGVAAILEAVARVAESGEPHPGLQVILSVAEERGLVGARAMDLSRIDADVVLVLDAAGEIGGLVVSAPTQWNFEALFHGTASHAGVSPEKGVSALAMAAEAICAMRLGRVDALSTANIGVVSGGVDTNVVAPEARVTGECRSQDPERVEELKSAMEDAMSSAAANHGGTVDVTWSLQYRGYSVSQDDEIYTLVASACGDVGVEAVPYTTGGGADSNVLAQAGVPVLALACAMRDVHSSSEHLRIDDLETLTALVEAVIGRATEED